MKASPDLPQAHTDIAVVVATHQRADRLRKMLDGLRAQTMAASRFQVIVVDDASTDATRQVLEEAGEQGDLRLQAVRREKSGGPAVARDEGWRASQAPVVAFTDDDCVPDRSWLESGLAAIEANPGAFIQGRTLPDPSELSDWGPFSRTINVPTEDPAYQTCNIFYPRELLEAIGGFDVETFGRDPGGEDADLAWRVIGTGAAHVFAPDALVHHAVANLGPVGKLRVANRWTSPLRAYARHPDLRRAHFARGPFWKETHYLLIRTTTLFALAHVLPVPVRRLVRALVAARYAQSLAERSMADGASPTLGAYYLIHDAVETLATVRASAQTGVLML